MSPGPLGADTTFPVPAVWSVETCQLVDSSRGASSVGFELIEDPFTQHLSCFPVPSTSLQMADPSGFGKQGGEKTGGGTSDE